MLTIFVFDERESRREEDLPDGLKSLDDKAMLWVALRDPTEEEVAAVQEAFQLSDQQAQRCSSRRASRRWQMQASTCT